MSKIKKIMLSVIGNNDEIIDIANYNKTIISSGTEINGNLLKAVGDIFIDGKINCNIEIDGDVVIGINGKIIGNIQANYINCSGDVNGNITCKETTHLRETANVFGDVVSTAIVIDEGAVFSGNFKTEARFFQEKTPIKELPLNDIKEIVKEKQEIKLKNIQVGK